MFIENHILPQFENRDRIRIIEADAFSYVGGLIGDEFDYWIDDAIQWYLGE